MRSIVTGFGLLVLGATVLSADTIEVMRKNEEQPILRGIDEAEDVLFAAFPPRE